MPSFCSLRGRARPRLSSCYRVRDALVGIPQRCATGIRVSPASAPASTRRARRGTGSRRGSDTSRAYTRTRSSNPRRASSPTRSAAALLGLPLFGEPRRHPRLRRSVATKSRRFGDVFVHTTRRRPRDRSTRGGLHDDLRRRRPRSISMRVLPAPFGARRRRRRALARRRAAAPRSTTSRGRRRRTVRIVAARCAADLCCCDTIDPRSESPGESVGRAVIIWSGFEPPELQREFRSEGFVDRVDYSWSERAGDRRVGRVRQVPAPRRRPRPCKRVDRARSGARTGSAANAMSSADGTWPPPMAVQPVVKELDRMGIPRVGAPRAALLATMRSNPRSFRRRRDTADATRHRRLR